MKNINTNAALTHNTDLNTANRCTPGTPAVQLPPCIFAGGVCSQCAHYHGQYCYKHKSYVDPNKWSCSYFE